MDYIVKGIDGGRCGTMWYVHRSSDMAVCGYIVPPHIDSRGLYVSRDEEIRAFPDQAHADGYAAKLKAGEAGSAGQHGGEAVWIPTTTPDFRYPHIYDHDYVR